MSIAKSEMTTIEAPQAKGGGLAVAGLSVGFVLMWSSGFVGGRLGTQSASTLTLMSWRFLAILPIAVQCATSAVAFTLLAAAAGRLADPVVAEPAFWGALAWLIAFSTLGGYGFYWLTMRRAGATRLGSLVYLTPPTTAVWAWLMFGDELTPAAIAGFAVCLLGVAVVFGPTRRRNRRA